MLNPWSALVLAALCGCILATGLQAGAPPGKTRNVVLIISDGLRWQEVFSGAEERLMTKSLGGVKEPERLRQEFWRDTPEARRQVLFPFLWTHAAAHGQLFGNQRKASVVAVTNGKKFSYPGYNEILTGAGDPRIDSNDKKPNPNVTVFEWLHSRPGFDRRVAVFGTWDVFPYIFNLERSRLPIWPVSEPKFTAFAIQAPELVNLLKQDTTPMWDDLTYDSFLFHAAAHYLKREQPRLLFVGFGETDEWAHAGRYDKYLTAARHVDGFIERLWAATQAIPQYKDQTTFIITADHGRGGGRKDWKSHGARVTGSEGDWIVVLGPDTPPLGERTNTRPHTQSQIAATIAALLGEDYRAAFPNAGGPLTDILGNGAGAARPR
jgi:hypothetical protein